MNNPFFEKPILNSPYEYPSRHWELDDTATRLLSLPGEFIGATSGGQTNGACGAILQQRQSAIQKDISECNARFFEAEADKLDGWADDLKIGLEREIKELDRQIKEARRAATAALALEEKLAGQKQIKVLEAQRNQKRRSLFDAQDEVDRLREKLIARIEGKLQQKTSIINLFEIRWHIQKIGRNDSFDDQPIENTRI